MALYKKSEKFLKPNDPILVQKAEEVSLSLISSDEVKKDLEEMLGVAYGEQGEKDKPILVGLAAPQIGISKRIILVDILADGKGFVGDLRVYINPEIISQSEDRSEWYEGCFSTDRIRGIVSRPTHIKIRAFTPDGVEVEEEHSGYVARIFQHEIDHLNGLEFVSHITDDSKLHWVEDDEFFTYRNEGAWRDWPCKCPRERWEKIKGIII